MRKKKQVDITCCHQVQTRRTCDDENENQNVRRCEGRKLVFTDRAEHVVHVIDMDLMLTVFVFALHDECAR